MEHGAETATGVWSVPQCPFRIEYSTRVLDDIRLAVVDAFFSLPRGGAEIGGILLGQWHGDLVSITGFEPLDCEHATGPSFTLSARDQTLMADMISLARRNPPNRQPVGWYHSHTRSEIFLSANDQEIHNRFFPKSWQVALVLRPHTFEPTRAGFFFREAGGAISGSASYQEFRLDPMPLRPLGANGIAAPEASPEPPPPEQPRAESRGKVPITREIAVEPPVATSDSKVAPVRTVEFDAPNFGQVAPGRSWRGFRAAAIVTAGIVAGGMGYQTRQSWLPLLVTKARAVLPKEAEAYLSLAVSDDNGQLKIQWDRNAPAVRDALAATLQISDGNTAPRVVRLDRAQLAAGGFTYARENEQIDVALIAAEPGGAVVKGQTSFLGKLPPKETVDPQAAADRQAEAQRTEQMKKDLQFQAAKILSLEKELKEQLQKNAQTADPPKKD